MTAESDHNREMPPKAGGRTHSSGNFGSGSGARPHNHSGQSGRQSISEQLTAAAQQQSHGTSSSSHTHSSASGGSSQSGKPRPSISEQLTAAVQQQSGQQSSSSHASSSLGGSTQQFATNTAPTSAQAGRKRSGMLLPLALVVIAVLALGGMGGSCMMSPSTLMGTGTTGGSSTYGTPSVNGTYTISNDLGTGNADDTWTVLMYVCGSNLESTSTRMGGGLATSNLVELTQANLGSNVNYVIETGGAKAWQNDVVSARYLERYAMEGGYMTQKDRVASASMAESSTLADFLNWGFKNYPADHYMLVIWDHGGGSLTGVCNDDLYPYTRSGEADSLTLPELRDALKASNAQFDVIGFDTCLMATLETAEILSPYSKYMVASEESEPGTGWDYTAWPAWLAQHTGTSGADLGTVICQTYYNKCANVGVANTATLSTIDLSKAKMVSAAFQSASDDIALATVDSKSLRKLYQGAGKSESYGNDGMYSMNMVDLGDLMSKTRDVIGSDADTVINAIDKAVVFETHGRNRGQASGLSVFYPLQITDRNDFYKYAEVTNNTPYLQFLGVIYGVYDKYDWTKFDNYVSLHGEPVNENKVSIAFDQSVNRDGHVQLQVTSGLDQVAQVEFEFYVYLDELNLLCFLGSDNDLSGSYDTGQFTDNYQNDWLAIDGNYVSASLCEQGNGYNLYYVPVNLNGERTGLLVEYDYSTNEFGVLCAWDENDSSTGMAGRTGRKLEEGDTIEFLFPALNTETQEQSFIPLGTMTWYEEPTIAYEDLGDGTYAFRYTVTDILGNEQKGDLVYERYENGSYAGQL